MDFACAADAGDTGGGDGFDSEIVGDGGCCIVRPLDTATFADDVGLEITGEARDFHPTAEFEDVACFALVGEEAGGCIVLGAGGAPGRT